MAPTDPGIEAVTQNHQTLGIPAYLWKPVHETVLTLPLLESADPPGPPLVPAQAILGHSGFQTLQTLPWSLRNGVQVVMSNCRAVGRPLA